MMIVYTQIFVKTQHKGNCDWYLSEIRWTDKVSVKSNGDIIDFNGRVVGHINLEIMKGGADMRGGRECITQSQVSQDQFTEILSR